MRCRSYDVKRILCRQGANRSGAGGSVIPSLAPLRSVGWVGIAPLYVWEEELVKAVEISKRPTKGITDRDTHPASYQAANR
jgi:hypothetical protein